MARALRSDALPENIEYRDSGCPDGTFTSCLSCPLSVCRYDVEGGLRTLRNLQRDQEIRASRAEGLSVDEISDQFEVSRRTVFRALASRGYYR